MIGIKTLLLRLTGFDELAELFVMEEVLKKKRKVCFFCNITLYAPLGHSS